MSETFLFPLIFLAIFALSYFGVEMFRRWSLRRDLLDHPNERSSHTAPTPRGGGVVIVVLSLLSYTLYTIFVTGTFAWWYVAGALLIAAVSWLDDWRSVSFVWRFAVHSLAAFLVIFFVGYFAEIYLPIAGLTLRSEITGMLLTFFWIVWLTNAYNFMDGIDGIAGMQCVTAGIGWLIVGQSLNLGAVGFFGGALAFAGLGFLLQNWQPAKIFMGDVGSAFLGYTFAVIPLLSYKNGTAISGARELLPMLAITLTWLFVFDTVRTLIKRTLKKERIWQAHRSHIYQQMVIAGFSHQTVTVLYGALSIINVAAAVFYVSGGRFGDLILIFLLATQAIVLMFLPVLARRRSKNAVKIVAEEI